MSLEIIIILFCVRDAYGKFLRGNVTENNATNPHLIILNGNYKTDELSYVNYLCVISLNGSN